MTTTPVLKSGSSAPSGLVLPVNTNFLNPMDALAGLPVPVGAYLFGGSDLDGCLRNYANPDLPLTVVGSPTINSVGATFNNYNGFDTGLLETLAFSSLIIAQGQTNSFWGLVTGPASSSILPRGVGLGYAYAPAHQDVSAFASSKGVAIGQGMPNASASSVNGASGSDWVQLFSRADDSSVDCSGQRNNSRVDGTTAMTDGGRGTSKFNFMVGATDQINGSAGVSFNLLAAFVWNTKLGDTDRNNTLAALRTWFNTTSGLGITTL